jgi:hypothetical protein
MSRKKRKKTPKRNPVTKARKKQLQREWGAVEGAKSDVHTGGVGAPPADNRGTFGGYYKADAEEAIIAPCPECGSSGGRHLRSCSRAS